MRRQNWGGSNVTNVTFVPKCDTFFCDSTPFDGAFGTNVTFVTKFSNLF